MKKVIVAVAVVLGSLTSFATITPIENREEKVFVQEFTEIKTTELPDAVKTALKTSYPDATLNKAYVNSSKEYKLEITVVDQKATVYSDANGNWIKK